MSGSVSFLFVGVVLIAALGLCVYLRHNIIFSTKAALHRHGLLDDGQHLFLRSDENFGTLVDRFGDVWIAEKNVPKLAFHRKESRNLDRIVGPRPSTAVEKLVSSVPVDAERDETMYSIFWSGERATVSLNFEGGHVTAVMSPAHPDYPATRMPVSAALELFWPSMQLDDGRDDGVLPRWFFPALVQQPGDIVDRLRGRYPVGPIGADGEPEFGYRQFDGMPPIHHEAADIILEQRRIIEQLETLMKDEDEGGQDRHLEGADHAAL